MKYYLGVDNGGTNTKAALYDQNGRELCVVSRATDMLTPAPGFAERDMEDMWQTNAAVIRELIERSAVDPASIAAVGCCGHGKGLYLWGKDERPLLGLLSADNRAWRYPLQWEKDGRAQKVRELTCQSILSCQPVSILAWLRDNRPELCEQIKYIFSCKDFVRFCLTGEAYAELTDISGTNLLNLNTAQYDRGLLELLGLEQFWDCLPPLRRSADMCGRVSAAAAAATGLCEGTPVAGGMFDIDACAVAVGMVDESRLCMIAGTWSINEYIRKSPVNDGSVRLNSLFCIPGYYLVEESSPTSAGNNQWYADNLLPEAAAEAKRQGRSIWELCNEWVESVDPAEFCPVFLPFILASNVHPNAKGSLVGITAAHTRAHITRAIYEGITFCHRWHLEKLLASRGAPPDCIRLAGGAARSAVWTQMFADICRLPVEVADIGESGALGAAITASVASGDYPGFAEASAAMVRIKSRVEPRAEFCDIYDKKYELYKKAVVSLDGLWDDIEAYIEG